MMNTLLESRPRKQRSTGTTIFSVVFHSAIVLLAVFATARAGVPDDKEAPQPKVNFVRVKKAEPAPVKKAEPLPPKPKAKSAPKPQTPAVKPVIAPPKGFKVLEAPIVVPTEIPKIDLTATATNEADFSGKGAAGGTDAGEAGAVAGTGVDTGRNYAEFEVEREVKAISGTSVQYPEVMRSSGAEGEVLAEFVVNENGRVETGTFKVLNSSNAAFVEAVKNALPRMRFRPAQIGKTNVSQVVQQAFVFKLNK
jgi:protein TonB